jgi:ribonuclease P protein component
MASGPVWQRRTAERSFPAEGQKGESASLLAAGTKTRLEVNKNRLPLRRTQILRGFQAFSRVISGGHSVRRTPLRAFLLVEPGRPAVHAGFTAGRNLRGAVQRNRARRWMKEAYRLNRTILDQAMLASGCSVNIVFMLSARGTVALRHAIRDEIHRAMLLLLHDLAERMTKT